MVKNLSQHLKCASHLKSAGEEQARRETKEVLDRLRVEDLERLQRSENQYASLSGVRQTEVPVPVNPPPDVGEQQMWDDLELDQPSAPLLDTSPANPTEQQEAEFYRVLDRAGVSVDPTEWGFNEFDVERDVDETLTNVMENLGSLRRMYSDI